MDLEGLGATAWLGVRPKGCSSHVALDILAGASPLDGWSSIKLGLQRKGVAYSSMSVRSRAYPARRVSAYLTAVGVSPVGLAFTAVNCLCRAAGNKRPTYSLSVTRSQAL